MTIENDIPTELVVFDFDETIVNCNSDTFINALAPGGTIPEKIWEEFLSEDDWTLCMEQVFRYLHKHGVREADYKQCLAKMPFVESVKELIENLGQPPPELKKQFEVIVISDANSFFINHTLEHHHLSRFVKKVFTNKAHFDDVGCLQIERFHEQNWCNLSAKNLCKGHVLKEYVAKRASENVKFDRISYAGDGSNDLCPSLKLSSNDNVFPRFGYPLHKLLAAKIESKEFQAKMHPFVTGMDIWSVLSS